MSVEHERGLLREPWSEVLGDQELVSTLEEVLLLVANPQAEAAALSGERHLRAVGSELAWTAQWMVQVAGSWRAAEEVEAWEDRLLAEAEAVARDTAGLSGLLLGGVSTTAHLGDGLRAWRLCHLDHGRQAVVRLLKALEQSVEGEAHEQHAGLALLGELYAAEQALCAAAEELRGLSGVPPAPTVLEQLTVSVERLRIARAAGATDARKWRASRAAPPSSPGRSTEPLPDPAVPLPLLAVDLLLIEQPSVEHRNEVVAIVADEVASRREWGMRSLHPQAVASLVVGEVLNPQRRRETLESLGREVAAGRAAARLLEALHPPQAQPSAVQKALAKLVEAGRVEQWEADSFLLVHRGTLGGTGRTADLRNKENGDGL